MSFHSKSLKDLRATAEQCRIDILEAGSSPLVSQTISLDQQVPLNLKSLLQNGSTSSADSGIWIKNPMFFTRVSISNLACYKILQHAVEGGDMEVMGMLIGNISKSSVVVYDCYALPVEGTETRVNAQLESYEYMVQYLNEIVDSGTNDRNIVGWYHSHPGYGCWLSGIDVQTQQLNQNFQDPYVAIVVDPKKSLQEGRLAIGAFRTLPQVENERASTLELAEKEKYGHYSSKYYELEMGMFQSELDQNIEKSQLRVEVPKVNSIEEPELLGELVESVKTWKNYQKLMNETQTSLPPSAPSAVEETSIDVEGTGTDIDHWAFRSQRNSRSASVISITTNDNGSDVNMDVDSRYTDDNESMESSITIPTELPVNIERNLKSDPLKKEYQISKRRVELLKIEEYEKLRFYRDAFTL